MLLTLWFTHKSNNLLMFSSKHLSGCTQKYSNQRSFIASLTISLPLLFFHYHTSTTTPPLPHLHHSTTTLQLIPLHLYLVHFNSLLPLLPPSLLPSLPLTTPSRSKYFAFDSCLDEWTERLVKHSNVTFVNGIVQELRFYKVVMETVEE